MPGFNRQSPRDLAARIALARSLRAAADAQPELTIAQISTSHGISRASAYRVMAELAAAQAREVRISARDARLSVQTRDPLCE